jgi:hypothetical protein
MWDLSFDFGALIPVSDFAGQLGPVAFSVPGNVCVSGSEFANNGEAYPYAGNLGPPIETVSGCENATLTGSLLELGYPTLYAYDGDLVWTLQPTPEPGSLLLLGIGLMGMVIWKLR